MTQDAAVNATHEADDTALRLALAENEDRTASCNG
jgi:hypothetical protein